jgi:tol-pal system protein YbgF
MFKAPMFALLLGASMLMSPAALAQRAKVSQGPTTSELAAEVTAARQQSANLQLEVTGLMSDVRGLNGKIETLEFQLSQAQERAAAAEKDSEALAKESRSLKTQLDAQNRAIASLEARLSALGTPSSAPSTYVSPPSSSSSTPVTRTYTIPTPQAGSTSSGPAVITPAPSGTTRPVSSSAPQPSSGSLGTISASALPGSAGPLFASARSKLMQHDYEGAETEFRAFIETFGSDPQAAEAHYWLADSLYQQKAHAEAGVAYAAMIKQFPQDARAPDALVRLARAMRLVGDKSKACAFLNELPVRYPTVSANTSRSAAVERTEAGCTP